VAQAPTASRRKKTAASDGSTSPRRQRLLRDIALILIAPFLLYLLV